MTMESSLEPIIGHIKQMVEQFGYSPIEVLRYDFGRAIKLVMEKDGNKYILPIIQCEFDVNADGDIVDGSAQVYYLNIAKTPWELERYIQK